MSWSRAAEWLGITAAIGVWTASFIAAGPALSEARRVADDVAGPQQRAAMDPMFVRDARPDAGVQGLVLDTAGLPVPNAVVFVYPNRRTPSVESRSYRTDTSGRFMVRGLAPGHYSFVTVHSDEASGERDDVPVFRPSTQVEIVLDGEPIDA